MKPLTKGKQLKSYNNYLLWILKGVFLFWVGFHFRADI